MTAVLTSLRRSNQAQYESVAQDIWSYAEMGYQEEERSSTSVTKNLGRSKAFSVEAGVADIPTAFVATYGSGGPVIAIFGEYSTPFLDYHNKRYPIS